MINSLITEFSVEQLKLFFRRKIKKFKSIPENYEYLFEDREEITDNFTNIIKIGDADLMNNDDLLVITAKTNKQLTNRTGKKRQYEIAKKILKEKNKDAAFFVFYDEADNFRFSFIRANFLGTRRDFTDFKRYTYFVSKKLTNKTFISQISKADFNDLNSIQEAFNVEPLTKQFYEKLQHWYFWANDNVQFPDDAEEEKNGREIAIIRLITRLMFIWFMKVRDLIPDDLFNEDNIDKILQDSSSEESTYYKAILQNLFFATLNTKQEERKFRTEIRGHKGYNPDFGNQNVFRYHDLFKDSESLKILFEKIPFLNGGLFECLDYRPKGKDKAEKKYIDGFTATKSKQPIVPNFLFFSEPQKKDISKFYGKKNKTYEVEGLIDLLKSYNFTIDENEADDIEVALDPELLGSIFENLLASYNPETATTARKATGSFYTPREIVNYMTNESLKQYFITNLKTDTSELPDADLEKKIDLLIKSNNSENPFNTETSQKITKLIDNLRIVDPAVGSGAFPMAVLNKLVYVLSKIDPDNTFWKNSQINGVKKSVTDPVMQRKLIEQIERQFQEKNADYGRKLYLIEKCIYGVDIQQIAVEIAKLRFFISLLVDEKIEWNKPENNYGIEPLPNLDFKLMQGNSLISSFAGIDFDKPAEKSEDSLFDMDEANTELISKFEELKNEYQNESEKEKKDDLREKIENCIYRIVEEKIIPQIKRIEEKYSVLPNLKQREKAITEEKQKLAKRLGFDIQQIEKDLKAFTEGRKPKDFFLWNVYFAEVFSPPKKGESSASAEQGVTGGFDIVIGNPPYIDSEEMSKNQLHLREYCVRKFKSTKGNWDLYIPFYEQGHNLLKSNGIITYITPNKWLSIGYGKKLRELLFNDFMKLGICEKMNVFDAGNSPVITFFQKGYEKQYLGLDEFSSEKVLIKYWEVNKKDIDDNWGVLLSNNFNFVILLRNSSKQLKKKYLVENPFSTAEAYKIKNLLYSDQNLKNNNFKFINTGTIDPFCNLWGKKITTYIKNKYDYPTIRKDNLKKMFPKRFKQSVRPKLIITGMRYFEVFFDKMGTYIAGKSTIIIFDEFDNIGKLNTLSALLNSNLISFYIKQMYSALGIDGGINFSKPLVEKLPIKDISKPQQKHLETLVNKIISKKELGEDTKELEDKIDLMVYKLYELTYKEVKIVDPVFALTESEYEDFKIR